jgi:hypothetical protein
LNGGKHWEKFMNDYPTVRTDDIFIHPREGDVIVATHGRSIFIADDITPLGAAHGVGAGAGRISSHRVRRSRTSVTSRTTRTSAD